ncbi:uncharacterized protein BP5553_00576 [Venustampulla echinocandica]|uniref:Uncharacterized protein n=1 Tax=Venustampulla echinocandica TaxID=2656787 RepID=A0A370TYI4_9HELO|nr:uncharacterized protein BP5553_00576 [Venustampulla echinocandica]RDL40597.1 hypothetical protein BP5553_00576 [Venustampulla echinocandica]
MAVQSRTSALLAYPIALVNAVISPSTRQNAYDAVFTFAKEQPLLTSFIIPHIILSFLPLALFLSFALGTIILSFIVALLFSLFWVGVALGAGGLCVDLGDYVLGCREVGSTGGAAVNSVN